MSAAQLETPPLCALHEAFEQRRLCYPSALFPAASVDKDQIRDAEAELNMLTAELGTLAELMAECPAGSLAELRMKASALEWVIADLNDDEGLEVRVARSVVRDILALA